MLKYGLALDIDDTIADTSRACIRHMLEKFGQHPLTIEEIRTRYGYPSLVPEWQLPQYQSTLQSLYQSTRLYQHVQPLPGAIAHTHQLATIAPIQCYITSRMTHLHDLTAEWLERHDFPAAPLICRPPEIQEPDWKIRFLVHEKYHLVGIVDNELYVPSDVDFHFRLFELVEHQKISPAHPALEICDSWQTVIEKLRQSIK